MNDFAGRTGAAVVTGGSGGIGAAIVRMLAERGSDVLFTYRSNRDAADAIISELSDLEVRVVAMPADLVDESIAASVVSTAVAEFGGIHTLVHAAGPHVTQIHLSRVEPAAYRAQIEGEAVAFFNVVQPALEHLRKVGGSIVAVTTAATRRSCVHFANAT